MCREDKLSEAVEGIGNSLKGNGTYIAPSKSRHNSLPGVHEKTVYACVTYTGDPNIDALTRRI